MAIGFYSFRVLVKLQLFQTRFGTNGFFWRSGIIPEAIGQEWPVEKMKMVVAYSVIIRKIALFFNQILSFVNE
jgi:hypothetical protein